MRSAPHGRAATGDHWCSRIHNEFWWWSRAKRRSRNRDCLCRMQGVESQIMDRVERCRDMVRVSGNCAGGNTRRQKGLHCSLIMRERRERFCPCFETRRLDTCPQSPRQRREEGGEGRGGGDGDGASPRDCPSLAFPFSIFLWGRKGERAQGKPRQDSGTPHGLAKNRRSGAGLWTCLQKPRSARVACGDHTCNSNHRSVSMDLSTSYMYILQKDTPFFKKTLAMVMIQSMYYSRYSTKGYLLASFACVRVYRSIAIVSNHWHRRQIVSMNGY